MGIQGKRPFALIAGAVHEPAVPCPCDVVAEGGCDCAGIRYRQISLNPDGSTSTTSEHFLTDDLVTLAQAIAYAAVIKVAERSGGLPGSDALASEDIARYFAVLPLEARRRIPRLSLWKQGRRIGDLKARIVRVAKRGREVEKPGEQCMFVQDIRVHSAVGSALSPDLMAVLLDKIAPGNSGEVARARSAQWQTRRGALGHGARTRACGTGGLERPAGLSLWRV